MRRSTDRWFRTCPTPDANTVRLVGRLKPGQSLEQGRAAVDAVDRRLGRLAGRHGVRRRAGIRVDRAPCRARTGRRRSGSLVDSSRCSASFRSWCCSSPAPTWRACSSRAVHGGARRSPFAWRSAARDPPVQQFLVEGFWLALIGTAAGLALSVVFMRLVNSLSLPVPIPIELNLAPTRRCSSPRSCSCSFPLCCAACSLRSGLRACRSFRRSSVRSPSTRTGDSPRAACC